MHPQVFLKTFWQMKFSRRVFVAMDFGAQFKHRYKDVIAPAIRDVRVKGMPRLVPYRVDNSKTGDSILTDILEAIAHSQMILADVSAYYVNDSNTPRTHKRYSPNGNVMYEVGVAMACRQPQEVLLISDSENRAFDINIFPHEKIEFTDIRAAKSRVRKLIQDRLTDRNYFTDTRVQLAVAGTSNEECASLRCIAKRKPNEGWCNRNLAVSQMLSVSRLLDKGLIRLEGQCKDGTPCYAATPLGRVVAKLVASRLRTLAPKSPNQRKAHLTARRGSRPA